MQSGKADRSQIWECKKMELQKAVRNRRSVRQYRDTPVKDEQIRRILEAALWAPCANERWRFAVVRNEITKKAISSQRHVHRAPVDIVVFIDLRGADKQDAELYAIQETAAAIQNMLLTAHEEGLSTCWNGSFDNEAICEYIKAPEGWRAVAVVSVGYPAEKPDPPERKPFDQVVYFETIE